jgi:hypothetical protein
MATAVNLAASRKDAPANAAAGTMGTVGGESMPALSSAEIAEQEAVLKTYMHALGML